MTSLNPAIDNGGRTESAVFPKRKAELHIRCGMIAETTTRHFDIGVSRGEQFMGKPLTDSADKLHYHEG